MKSITIIGGGLAGLTLGILLRRAEVPVTVWEAGDYPRHRVCGEFISGEGLQTLERLGLLSQLPGACVASSVAFFSRHTRLFQRTLPQESICISRFHLDTFLADTFRRAGGELRVNSRWNDDARAEGLVYATGRRVTRPANGFHWHGFKAHVRGVTLSADLEMHFHEDGYIGACRLRDGTVNVCGLFRRSPGVKALSPLLRFADPSSKLGARLQSGSWDGSSVCAVAGLDPYPELAEGCCVGDALTMPAPLTGNGMSMAFESAEIASEPLASFARSALTWDEATGQIRTLFRARFQSRLKWSSLLHRILFSPSRDLLVPLAGPLAWSWLFRKTR
jgi:menaquinone-9 beta-reductase